MNHKDFLESAKRRMTTRLELLEHKGLAYAGDADAFANFKRNSDVVGVTRYQTWFVYFQKHMDAITRAIKDNPSCPVDKTEGLQGRIDDSINYLELLAGMLAEDTTHVKPPIPEQIIVMNKATAAAKLHFDDNF